MVDKMRDMLEKHGITKYGMRKEGTFALLANVQTFVVNGDEISIVIAVPNATKLKASKYSNIEICGLGLSLGIKGDVCSSSSAGYINT